MSTDEFDAGDEPGRDADATGGGAIEEIADGGPASDDEETAGDGAVSTLPGQDGVVVEVRAGGAAGGPVPEGTELYRLPIGWHPRGHQAALWHALRHGARRADVVAHRRWGKDEVALHWTAACASCEAGVYWHLLPEAAQGRRAIWDAVNPATGKRRIDEAFPSAYRAQVWESEMKIRLVNGAIWQVLGSDNYNSLVGAGPRGVVFSEWSLCKPEAWSYVRPILAQNGGWAMFIWTPRGRNHAARAFESRRQDPEWLCLKAGAEETQVFTPQILERERRELIAETGSREEGEARFASEYLVDFDAASPGAYYATLLADAEREGRIGRAPVDPAVPVDTAWDLGIDDYTAIWFFQQIGREVRVVDYFEASGEGLPWLVREAIASKTWTWGAHHLPHDVMARELGTGRSRYETLRSLGLNRISVGVATDPEDRVNAARLMIPQCWFDAERCAQGLDRLRAYRKRWNRATSSYSGPLHDQASHGADAFGEFALNRRLSRDRPSASAGPSRAGGPLSWMG